MLSCKYLNVPITFELIVSSLEMKAEIRQKRVALLRSNSWTIDQWDDQIDKTDIGIVGLRVKCLYYLPNLFEFEFNILQIKSNGQSVASNPRRSARRTQSRELAIQ